MARGMKRPAGMHAKTHKGLMKYGRATKTKDIHASLVKHGVVDDSDQALAAWIRRNALGAVEFKRHQTSARRKKK